MSDIVIGAGQVGRAIAEVLGCPIRDLDPVTVTPTETIHICFPWSDDFNAAVLDYQVIYGAELTVIHSTVPVGTSRRLGAVHSPVTGKHPHLAESVRTFVKMFGGPDAESAAATFAAHGVRTESVPDAETTEAGKLWATLQYGWLVALQKEAYRFCRGRGADPDIAYRRFNEIYNEGYEALGEPHRLPLLEDMAGPIGGHCVIPNARFTPAYLARILVRLNGTW